MKRALPFWIIIGVFVCGLLTAMYWKRATVQTPLTVPTDISRLNRRANIRPGATPPHTLGTQDAPVMLEEFGDFSARRVAFCILY
jgi:hypothetical protein